MKLLAIETATESCSVALWQDGECLEHWQRAERQQTALVLPMVQAVMAEAGLPLSAVDVIGFGCGPGAFTGVRVAVAVAQGLGFSLQRPLVGVSTLATLALEAAQAAGDGDWLVAQDARMNELYLGCYRVQAGALTALAEDQLAHPQRLPAWALSAGRLVGSGQLFEAELRAAWPVLGDWLTDIQPRARSVAALAVQGYQQGQAIAAEQAQPLYLRDQVIQGAVR